MRPSRVFKLIIVASLLVAAFFYIVKVTNKDEKVRTRDDEEDKGIDFAEEHKDFAVERNDIKSVIKKEDEEKKPEEDSSPQEEAHQQNEKSVNLSDRNPSSVQEMRSIINDVNFNQEVHNLDKFPKRPEEGIIIVVQVHNRPEYLEQLVKSLGAAKSIEKALLIISHDYFSKEINKIVESIDFCQVMQIFFPFASQFYPDEFPGQDPNDCPRDIPRDKALEIECTNAAYPDMYGHYREAPFTMTKHHWWWKAHRVFEGLKATRDHKGLVLFLEEDHIVSQDFYPTLELMAKLQQSECPECDIISMGLYDRPSNYQSVGDMVDVITWQSSKHNMGMAYTRDTWAKIRSCSKEFCTFDDYNWDWTLQHVSGRCLPSTLTTMVILGPRVFHIGTCGMHHSNKDAKCEVEKEVGYVEDLLRRNKPYLDPSGLYIKQRFDKSAVIKTMKPNGGWADPRDHRLCMSYAKMQMVGQNDT
ncbi:Alpha-1,6-mannosyl-glycoprotein 2-beta-N-acetylglucosaminyltransferase [Branchiostoma belcheri]|nr:Alpha-1,6-mannosyl-glycoprotein 2-beta-N-acetylglucosaminyltransferase [Branchiostoma belcheri]